MVAFFQESLKREEDGTQLSNKDNKWCYIPEIKPLM